MESGNLALSGIPTNKIPSYISQNGLFKVKISEQQEIELNVANIQAIYYYNGYYYIIYSNPPVQTVPIPYLATKLNFQVKGIQKEICKKCGSEIEWDADEPYCPNCGDYYGSKYVSLLKITLDIDQKTELEQFLNKLFKVNVNYYKDYWWTIAGGSSSNFKLQKLEIQLFRNYIMGIGIVENPEFEEHHYDDFETYHHKESGKFIIVKVDAPRKYIYYLFTLSSEPDLTLFNSLLAEFQKQEEERQRKAEEERKKREEEERKRKEEELKKWGDENNVIKEIISKAPDWADGVIIKTKTIKGEDDYDVIIQLYPIKKSSWNNDYYTSFEWKPVFVNIPDQYLSKYTQKAILKNGQIVSVKLGEQKGKYTPISLA